MKQYIVLFISIGITISTLSSCRKGDRDPLFSLRSRKARLTGEWQLTKLNSYGKFDGSNGLEETSIELVGDSLFTTSTYSPKFGMYYKETITINKDGSYLKLIDTGDDSERNSGTWRWAQKNAKQDLKNKEMVIFSANEQVFTFLTTDYVDSYLGHFITSNWVIDELRNKKMVIVIKENTDYDGDKSEEYTILTYEKK